MASELVQMLKTLKAQRSAIKYLSSLNQDQLRSVLIEVIKPDEWSEVAKNAKTVSIQLEKLASVIERAAQGVKT